MNTPRSQARISWPATDSVGDKGALDGRANIDTCKGADSLWPGSGDTLTGQFLTSMRIAIVLLSSSVQAATLNDQVTAMPIGQWTLIQTENTVASIDPSRSPLTSEKCRQLRGDNGAPCNGVAPYYSGSAANMGAMFGAWNGAAVIDAGTCKTIAYTGGGHNDWFGNQVVGLDLCGSGGAPVWKLLRAPFNPTSSARPMMDVNGSFPDGTPSPAHTYGGLAGLGGMLFVSESDSCYNQGSCGLIPQYSGNAWIYEAGFWRGPFKHTGAAHGSGAADTVNNLFWFQPNSAGGDPGDFSRLNPRTGAIKSFGRTNASGLEHMMGFDPTRTELVLLVPSVKAMFVKDVANPAAPGLWVKATMTGAPAATEWAGGQSFAWSPRLQSWITFAGNPNNPNVYRIQQTGPTTFTWSLLTAPGSLAPITVTHNGLFGKYQVVQTPVADVLMGTVGLNGGVWGMRLPEPVVAADTVRLPCSSPGIFVCESFSGAPKAGALLASWSGSGVKPVVKDGTLVFTAPSNSAADAGGRYSMGFPAVGEGQTIAWSYRVRADKGMTEMPAPGWKEFTLWRGSAPCTDLEISVTHGTGITRPLITPYKECGAGGFGLPIPNRPGDRLVHYPDFDCRYMTYKTGDLRKCAVTIPDQWQDYYFEVTIGTYGQPNTRILALERSPGQPWRRFLDRADATLNGTGGFDHFMLTAYMTRKDPSIAHPPGEVRYDNLVLSRQPFFADLRD